MLAIMQSKDIVVWFIILGLLVVAVAGFYDFFRRPWGIARRFKETMQRWEIKTPGTGEYPILKRVKSSPYKEHELMLVSESKGMDLVTLDRHTSHLKAGLHGLTTVLTDLYDQTKDIKLAQAAAGHTTSAMTLRYYVKGRETISKAAAVVDRAYSG